LEVGFGHWPPHRGKLSKNVECLRHQREKEGRDAGHLGHQFAIVIKKNDIGNISRTEGRLVAKNRSIVGDNKRLQKIIMKLKDDLRSDRSKVRNDIMINWPFFER
jgi:predicted RNase H-like nuclease (RuvC/YqgF family)